MCPKFPPRHLSATKHGKCVRDVLKLGALREIVDAEDIEAKRNMISPRFRQATPVRQGHSAKHPLLFRIHGSLSRCKVMRGSGLYLEDHQRVAIPCDQIQVPAQSRRVPASCDHRVSQAAEVKVGEIFPVFPGDKVLRLGIAALLPGPFPCSTVSLGSQVKIERLCKPFRERKRLLHE